MEVAALRHHFGGAAYIKIDAHIAGMAVTGVFILTAAGRLVGGA
jgi:hypothetical protein